MRTRTGLIIASVIIVAMFVFDWVMMKQVSQWADLTVELSVTHRVLAQLAFVWHRYWFVLAPAIAGIFWTIGIITEHSESKRAAT